jgi:hypothetical protein
VKQRRLSPRKPGPALRFAVLALLLGFDAATLHPLLSTAELPASSVLGDHRDGDKACAARKTAAEIISVQAKRPSSPPLRSSVVALAVPFAAASPLRPQREGQLTDPTYLQIFRSASPPSLVA